MKMPYLDPRWVLDDSEAFTENDRIRVVLDNDQYVTLMMDPDPRRASATPVRLIVDRRNTTTVLLENMYALIQDRQKLGPHFSGRLAFIDRWLHKRLVSPIEEVRESAVLEYVNDTDENGARLRPLMSGVPLYLHVGMPGDFSPAIWSHHTSVIDVIEWYTM